MMKSGWVLAAALVLTNLQAESVEKMGEIFQKRCANCHGETAHGVPRIEEKPGVNHDEANFHGMASEKKKNIYGPPLNHLSKATIVHKLVDLSNGHFDSDTHHSDMRENLKRIEARDGKIDFDHMAEYITATFGDEAR